MKKIIVAIVMLCMIFTLAACGGESNSSGSSNIKFSDKYEVNGRSFGIPEGFSDSGDGKYYNSETGTSLLILNIDMGLYTSMLDDMDEDDYNTFINSLISSLEEQLGAESIGNSKKISPAGLKGMMSEAEYEGQACKICALLDVDNNGWYALILIAGGDEDIYYNNFDQILDRIK